MPLAQVAVLGIATAVDTAARAFEGDESRMGLRLLAPDGTFAPTAFPATLPEGAPRLLFIHGAASSTSGSFGKLRRDPARVWNEIHALYPGWILAFEHRSLTLDPVRSALDLLDALPVGIELHLVNHSRGGLAGELLARPQVTRRRMARPLPTPTWRALPRPPASGWPGWAMRWGTRRRASPASCAWPARRGAPAWCAAA